VAEWQRYYLTQLVLGRNVQLTGSNPVLATKNKSYVTKRNGISTVVEILQQN
jgi:hypothetical protein